MTKEKKKPTARTSAERNAEALAKRNKVAHDMGWDGSWESLATAIYKDEVPITIGENGEVKITINIK